VGNQPKYDRTIAEIADELEPWQQPWRGHREQVLRVIKDEIELVREDLTDHARDAIEKNRDNARDIIKSIDKLEKQLKKARFLWWLSSPANPAIESLRRISVVCKNYTEPNRQNYAKLYCARTAVCLIRLISEKSPTNGSTNAPLRIIAQKFHTILGPQTLRNK